MELRDLKGVVTRVPAASKETTIRQLLDLMVRQNTDVLPVVDGNTLVGIVTEKDLLRLVRAQPVAGVGAVLVEELPRHIEGRYVAEVMSRNPVIASPGQDVEDVIKKMAANGIRAIPVVENGQLLGIARARDILRKYYSFR